MKPRKTIYNHPYRVLDTYNPDKTYERQGTLIGPLNPLIEKLGDPNYESWDIKFPSSIECDHSVFIRIRLNKPPSFNDCQKMAIWGSDRRALFRVQELLAEELSINLYELIDNEFKGLPKLELP